MRTIPFIISLLLTAVPVFGQETVRGRIVNEQGEAVEYVQVGIPKLQLGTISTADGRFEISVPKDTLEFFHVSYQTGRHIVTGPEDDVVVVLHENELQPAVFTDGNTRQKYLIRPGTKVAGNGGLLVFEPMTGNTKGTEIGSVAKTQKPFLVRDIQFSIWQNSIPDCVASVNIYRIEKDDVFINVLQRPIYVNVAESDKPQEFHIQPDETLLLEPGKYFIAFQIVDWNAKALEERASLSTILYFKSSYTRKAALGKMEPYPFNIGMVVKGLEYRQANK